MDWERLLVENNIEYVTSGPNTKRGELSVKCPWCGDADPSQHLGISLSREAWGCHRDATHRGKSPVRLIQALLGCSASQARLMLAQGEQSDPDSLEAALMVLNSTYAGPKPDEGVPMPVQWPAEFRPITRGDRFGKYLKFRGYDMPEHTAQINNLKCATTGKYKDRIIFSLYLNNELIGWTGRAITDPVNAPRYLASSANVKMTLCGYEHAKGGDVLFVVEGPFDALRINQIFWMPLTVHAVALMGTAATVPQLGLLRGLSRKYQKVLVLLDKGADGPAMHLADSIGAKNVGWQTLYQVNDPAEASTASLVALVKYVLQT